MASAGRRPAGHAPSGLGRLWDGADLICWVAGLNLLVLVFTLLGGGVLGLAPALVAGAAVIRGRLRGDAEPLLRTFARTWRRELRGANLVLAPVGVVGTLLAVNLLALWPAGGPVVAVLLVAAALTVSVGALATTLHVHYDLPLRQHLPTAWRFALRNLPGTLLLAVVSALVVVAVVLLPGLLPTVALGAWLYLVVALCLSFYDRNDALVAAQATGSEIHE